MSFEWEKTYILNHEIIRMKEYEKNACSQVLIGSDDSNEYPFVFIEKKTQRHGFFSTLFFITKNIYAKLTCIHCRVDTLGLEKNCVIMSQTISAVSLTGDFLLFAGFFRIIGNVLLFAGAPRNICDPKCGHARQ